MKIVALTVALLLELVAFVSFAAFGYLFPLGGALHVVSFIFLLSSLVGFWSLFMAPRAPKKLKISKYFIAKTIVYAISATTVFGTKGTVWGALFVAAVIIDESALYKHDSS